MSYDYKPQNGSLASKFEIEKYENALENFDIYIQNILESYSYLLSRLDLNSNELAYQHGLINAHDISLGRELNVSSFIEKHLKEYTDELIKRAHLIGHAGGDIAGANWGANTTAKAEKTKRTQIAKRGGETKKPDTQERNKYFYDLINDQVKLNGIDILKKLPKYFKEIATKEFYVGERSISDSINDAKRKINKKLSLK